ncbi:hypothetical protein [Citrobacter braakii]|uniref:hypothetical protein n=1 Tax=Citrobacter braakii TaxID=57706 RepID=UPI001EF14255|nr:hypothetical protein [Citrobacter braakii]
MTVSTEVDHNDYIGNGVTTSFPYTFRIFKKSDLVVQVVDLNENITELILDTDYTVTGAGGYSGGNVILMAALANGYQISISRELPVTQETDLRNQGKFFAEVHEDAFDKLTMLIQQVRSRLRLALRKPSFVANYYDALGNYIRNLRDPSHPQDAATKNYADTLSATNESYTDSLFSRTLRTGESITQLPSIEFRKNKIIGMDDNGNPIMIIPESGTASEVLIELAKPTGTRMIGDPLEGNLYKSLNKRIYILNSVTDLLNKDFSGLDEELNVYTYANKYSINIISEWKVNKTKDDDTYSISLPSGYFANLIIKPEMSYAAFDFGSSDPVKNSESVAEACRVARANHLMSKLTFPSGVYVADKFDLDVDRRGFTFSGAGNDATIIMSTSSDISMHHVGVDPRDRNRDRLHWHQIVEGFTINGNVSDNGANAATRAIYTAPYATIKNKSINHRISNYDLLHLVLYWYGHSQGAINGVTSTKYGIRVRNNSIKIMGYIGGVTGQCTVSIEGMSTTLISAVAVGDTIVTVNDASGFDTWFEIAFTNSTGGVETRRITVISGNVLTLDRAMTSAFPSGTKVEVPLVGTAVVSSTIETGEIRIGDSQSTYLAGNYSEEAKIYLTKYVRALVITGMSTAEASPAISINVDKRSSIKIEGNDTTFSIAVNITDRSGVVGERIDLYSAPKLDIRMNTRVQNPIILNGVYGFSSLRIEKTFDSVYKDDRFTKMTFSGFNHAAPAGGSVTEVMKFFQDAVQFGFDGYTFDLDITCRRDGASAAVTPGLLKRYGTSSAAPAAQNSAPISLFSDFNSTTGYDVFIGSSGNRGSIQVRPHPSAPISISLSGVVESII